LDDHEGSLPTTAFSTASEYTTQMKINKYQGLDNYLKNIIEQEKKHEAPSNNEQKPNNDWKKKFPLTKIKAWFGLTNLDINQENMMPMNATEKSVEVLEKTSNTMMESKINKNDYNKSKRHFNKLFPPKKLKRRQSMQKLTVIVNAEEEYLETMKPEFSHRMTMLKPATLINDNSFEKEREGKTKKITRELSFKNFDCKDRLDFLEDLRTSSIEAPKEQILNTIKKILENEIMEKEKEEKTEISIIGKINGPWGEPWERKVEEFQKNSVFGHFPSYQIRNIIIKGGDDLRQELIAMQMIIKFKQIFEEAGLKLFLRPYDIMVTSPDSGILGDFYLWEWKNVNFIKSLFRTHFLLMD